MLSNFLKQQRTVVNITQIGVNSVFVGELFLTADRYTIGGIIEFQHVVLLVYKLRCNGCRQCIFILVC